MTDRAWWVVAAITAAYAALWVWRIRATRSRSAQLTAARPATAADGPNNRAMVLSEEIAEVLRSAAIRGELPQELDATSIVVIVSCAEPKHGDDAFSLSVVRFGCDPCEAAGICQHVIDAHDEQHHSDAKAQ